MNGAYWVLLGNRVVRGDQLLGGRGDDIRRECSKGFGVQAGTAQCHPATRPTDDVGRQALPVISGAVRVVTPPGTRLVCAREGR